MNSCQLPARVDAGATTRRLSSTWVDFILTAVLATGSAAGFAHTSRKGGPGTVMLKDSGGIDATVSFDLQPESGIVVKGTITCTNPLRY
jgi:hypothetical protein